LPPTPPPFEATVDDDDEDNNLSALIKRERKETKKSNSPSFIRPDIHPLNRANNLHPNNQTQSSLLSIPPFGATVDDDEDDENNNLSALIKRERGIKPQFKLTPFFHLPGKYIL